MRGIVFKGLVHRTEKNYRTKLDQTMIQSIFQLQLHAFGAILVAGCCVSKIFENYSITSFNLLQSVELSRELHTLVTTFITLNSVFGS